MNTLKLWLTGSLAMLLSSCSSAPIQSYQDEKPVLDVSQYFMGTIDGYGMFQDRSGKVVKRFHVVINAHWDNNIGTLDEHFTWSDNTTSQRIWTITKFDAHHYQGTAADVVDAAQGTAYGNALQWRYVLQLPVDGKVYNVNIDDWMYQIDESSLMNRSKMSKFGFHLGDITLYFKKRSA
ncbi:DUF3833 domain-containing protein [Sulfuriferula nivalis]|uniref:Lipoprotein n=1 Tax=Sulfuriferula nivalis TaxID=2675298 RepID=A0A809SHL2_9PROT|nr:DUF3833 domain-containing protein [Sulfuriferula nivalis]BBP00900.1 lipoprotein [Sulfuriferula nivalis]